MKYLLTPRTRLLSFRVSGEEYQRLRSASSAQGARCLSDFARSALLRAVDARDDLPLGQRVVALEHAVGELREQLRNLGAACL